MRGAAPPIAPAWARPCLAPGLCPSGRGGERANKPRKMGCHREGAKGKELSQGLAAGCNFLPSVGALTGNFEQLGHLPAELLHSNVCDGAQDHHRPLEAGCGRTEVLRAAGGKGRVPSTQAPSPTPHGAHRPATCPAPPRRGGLFSIHSRAAPGPMSPMWIRLSWCPPSLRTTLS